MEAKSKKTERAVVIGKSGNKSIRVRIDFTVKHPMYGKYLRRKTVLGVHDETNQAGVGDTVYGYALVPVNRAGKVPGVLYHHYHGGEYDNGKEEVLNRKAFGSYRMDYVLGAVQDWDEDGNSFQWKGGVKRSVGMTEMEPKDHPVYKSLSAIAKVVTGTHWNGHLFFGLRKGGKA